MASACTPCCSSSSTSSLPLHSNITILNLFPSQFQHLNNRFGLSFPPRLQLHNSDKGIRVRNSPRRLRVFCLREPNAAVVTGKSWDNLILKSEVPVLVEFYASWCGPCRMVHRMIDEIATEYSGRLNCFVLHADNDVDIAEEYDIKAVPVVLLFKNGEKHDSVIGTMPKEFYVAAIERVLAS